MPPRLALLVCLSGVALLILQDLRWGRKVQLADCVPLVWVLIVGSRPVSSWFGATPIDNLDGSPTDRLVHQLLIFGGLWILLARRIDWRHFLAANKFVVFYFVYCGISILWSDYPWVSLKRWTKDAGVLVMVLVVVSEQQPLASVKAVLVRCAYVLVPISVVLAKYFPDIGRAYDRWTGAVVYVGASGSKNLLGMTLTVCGLALSWAFVSLLDEPRGRKRTQQALVYAALLGMTVWVLGRAQSATATLCLCVGVFVLVLLRVRRVAENLWAWLAAGVLSSVILLLAGGAFLPDGLLGLLGRDASLTGRTAIWRTVLSEDINPFVGVGFSSFWIRDRAARLSADYYYGLNEAHSGYLETYLNGGVIGLALLLALLGNVVIRSLRGVAGQEEKDVHRFAAAVVILAAIYGITEAVFSRLDLVWFVLVLVAVVPPTRRDGRARPRSDGQHVSHRRNPPNPLFSPPHRG